MDKHRGVAEMLRDPRPIAGGDDVSFENLDEEITEQLGRVAELSDDELKALEDSLRKAGLDALEDEVSDEDLAVAAQAKAALESVTGEQSKREEAAAARAEQAEELRNGLTPVAEEDPEEDETETDTEGDGETETTETTEKVEKTETTEKPADEAEEEPLAAAAKKRKAPGKITPPASQRAVAAKPKSEKLGLVAAADVQGFATGAPIPTVDKLARATESKSRPLVAALKQNTTGRWGIAAAELEFPEERYLRDGDLPGNLRKIEKVASPEAIIAAIHEAGGVEPLIAAGGICTPLPVRYELGGPDPSTARPFRDALVRFGADRGGVSIPDPLTLTDVEGAVGIWTETIDSDPGAQTKTLLTLTCGDNDDVTVDAITARVKTGNWLRRFSRERFDRAWQLIQAVHARTAENDLWRKAVVNSKNVSVSQDLGAARDILFKTGVAAAQLRNTHRLAFELPIQVAFPSWVRDMIAGDLIRQLPGDDKLAVAYREIDGYFGARNIVPIWSPDARQVLGIQPDDAAIVGYPATMKALMFPAGTFIFLDGGRLDFGMEIRDSTLNSTNDVEAFFETFEGLGKVGTESYEITFNNICADGSTSSTVDVACAGSGS